MASVDELYAAILKYVSEGPTAMKQNEAALQEMLKGNGMLLKLQQIALRRDIDLIVRQQAIVQAKNNTQLQWKSRVKTSEEDLVQLRQNVFLFIEEPDEVVAKNNQMMLAKAARVDFPNRWPDLLDTIMGYIQVNVQARLSSPSPDEGVLLRSRRSLGLLNAVLKEFVSMRSPIGTQICTKASAKVYPFLAPLVEQLTALLNTSLTPATINQPSTVYDVEITRLSWKCWSKMMLWAWGRTKKLSAEEEQAFRNFFSASSATVQQMWNYRMGAVQVAGTSPDQVTAQCLELLTKLVRGLGKSFRKMQTVAATRFVVLPGSTDLVMWYWSKVAETAQASEDLITGNSIAESALVPYPVPLVIQGMAIFKDSLSQWSPKKKEDAMDADNKHVETLSQSMVTDAVSLLITRYIPLKPSDLERWEVDPEEFLNAEDKENDQWEFDVRPCAERVLMALAAQYPDYVTPLLQQLFQSIISTPPTDLNGILQREAIYCALGRCAGRMKGTINLDEWLPILEQEVRNTNPEYRLLKRRIAWLFGKWHHDDSRPLAVHVKVWEVLLIVLTDHSAGSDSAVRLAAVIALRDCVENNDFDIESFKPFLDQFLANLYPVISESETVESKRRVFRTMNSIVGAAGLLIAPLLQPIAAPLPNLWTEADTEYMLKQEILIFVKDLVEATREHSLVLHPLIVMLIQQGMAPGARAQLDVDAMYLWEAAIRNCPSLQPVPNQPGLLDLLPPLVETLGSDMDAQANSNHLLESYYLIDCPLILQLCAPQLLSAYATAHQQALSTNIKDITESLELLIQLSGSALSWAEGMHLSGLFVILLRFALAGKGSVSVLCDHFYLFSRMVLQDPDVFVHLVASAAPALSQPPEEVFNTLMDSWWRNFDSMAESRHRKMTAMSMANLATTGQPQVMDRLATEITNVWLDVLGEIKEAEDDDPDNPPLHTYWNDGQEPPHYWMRGTEGTLEEGRRKKLWVEDPVQTIKMTKYIDEKLKFMEARLGKAPFDQIFTNKVDEAVLRQLREALAS
ncbi:hypothetical protein FRB90_004049 [Tulasnella sp. 427]|nr:hypothetical protein FRB90_004049 [Tulasnella sp. 427]